VGRHPAATGAEQGHRLDTNCSRRASLASGRADLTHYPSTNTIITGNVIDLTCVEETPVRRAGITVSANATTVSNNQVYVRGAADPLVTGIRLEEPAVGLTVHDNLLQNCGQGLVTARASASVGEVLDDRSFLLGSYGIPAGRPPGHDYKGWQVVWLNGGKVTGTSTLAGCDAETCRFTLTTPRAMKGGDLLEIYSPGGTHWNLHDNTIAGCLVPVVLDSYGSPTAVFARNLITRGGATGVKEALALKGRFDLLGNTFSGFDEPGSVAVALYLDRFGQVPANRYRGNVFDQCTTVVAEQQPGMWAAGQR